MRAPAKYHAAGHTLSSLLILMVAMLAAVAEGRPIVEHVLYPGEETLSLVEASRRNDIKAVQKGVEREGINSVDGRKHTALHEAALRNHVSIVEYLLQQPGIDVDAQDVDLYTPLMLAAHKGNKHIVKMLLEAGADQFKTSKHFHLNLNAHELASRHAHRSDGHHHSVKTLVGHAFGVPHSWDEDEKDKKQDL